MLISGTFTKAVMYLMLLSDSIIAGHFIGASGVAGINAITPVTAIVTFFGDLLSTGVGIVFTREVGAMRKDRANEIYGQGLILSIGLGLISALLILVLQDTYFRVSGVTGDILENALKYYRLVPINAFLTIVIFYLEQMVYSDGDELCNNICYGFQIGGNVVFSVILTRFLGMTGIILGSVIGNSLGILTCLWHYFRKENTLRFVWHLSFKDFLLTSRYSIVDSSVYICWGLMDYVMIGFVSSRFGEAGLITLAVVVSLIEFGVVMDGVGMAMQPLIGTYFGEKNHKLIRRVMRSGRKAAIIEGIAATALIWIFAKQFCALFGITGGAELAPSMAAIRIVSLGFVFCSLVPKEQVVCGIPFYTRAWTQNLESGELESVAEGMSGAREFCAAHGIDTIWDGALGQYVGSSEDGTFRYSIWMEDLTSLEERMELIKRYELAGTAAWRLGFEDATVWPLIDAYFG